LGDNVWHNIDEVGKALEIPQDKLQQIVKFLSEADMIQNNPATSQIKLNQTWKTLIINQKEPSLETRSANAETTAVGTIIIPPQKTLIIQCTRITNLTDNSLELEIRINKRINEIAIGKIK
jgi:hypothetical protein